MRPPYKGCRLESRGTYHIHGVLTQDTSVGEMPGSGMPRESTQYEKAVGTFDVQVFLVIYRVGSEGKGTASPLRHVWNAHARGAAHQALSDGTVRSEYIDEVAEKRWGDSGKLHGGNLQLNRG